MLQCNWSLDRLDDVLAADMKARHPRAFAHVLELFAVAEPFLDMCIMVASRWGLLGLWTFRRTASAS